MPHAVRMKRSTDDKILQWAMFRLGNEIYGIDVMRIREVQRYSEITPVPGAPSFILGVINLRGNIVTIVDTRMRFGLPVKEATDNTRIIIIEIADMLLGLMVDSMVEVTSLDPSEIEMTPMVERNETGKYIRGIANRDGEILVLVDLLCMIEVILDDLGLEV